MYMGKIIYGVLLLLVVGAGRLCAGQNEWENPEKYEWNKESPHTVFMWYDDELGALTGDFSKSPWHESLNGRWKFSYVPDIEDAEEGFYKKDFDDSSWADLDVPSNWELKGFGEPIIRNIQYVFPANPPYVDVDNPVGTYRKVFTVPEGWDGREVLLHFGSISGYAQVFLNGKRIGMTKAAKTPAEFNVTPYLCEGENLLAVRVYRWHDGSYMEDQDFWRLTGIERDVYLQAYPKSTVWDFFLHAGLDSRYRDGIFNATVDLRAFADSEPGKGQVEMKLVDKTGKTVWAQKRKFEMKGEAETLSFSGRIKNVAKWTAETPELYDCILTLRDEEGNTSVTACKTGFRKIEIKNAKLMVNGMPVYIKGVNRHEHSDTLGHVQTRDLILDDLKQMKRLNINAIRTCHYPNHPDFYDLCDRYGFYVVDEANIENHGMGSVPYFKDTVNHPAYREDWYAAHVDRIDRMVKRDKNHPCVIGWSLGNECGNGKVFHDEYKRLKAYDPSRFVQFEQAWEDWNTDVVCLMYPNMGRIKDYRKSGKQRPFIMCEYSHAMGNSCGGIADYTEYAYEEPLYQGGFIWEYMDHGIAVISPDGKPGFAYGGDFGDRPTDREFCVDGLVLPDRRNTPKMDAVKAAYAPLKITLTDTEVVIENRNLFTDLSAYDLVFASSVNGKPERRAVLRADCAPGKTAHIAFPFPLPETGLACMTVTAVQRAAKPGIPTGYEAAFGQVWHNYAAARLTVAAPELVEMDCNIGVKGDGFEYIFGRGKGLVSIRYNGVQLLDDTVRPNFWRAPTNNDEGCAEPFAFAFWKTAGLYARCDNLTAEAKDEFVIVRANYTLPDGQTLPIDFAIDGAGRCDITMTWQGEKTELPEFGLLFPMRRELTKVSYLGLGPRETTADRTAGGKMGAWSYNVRQDFAQNSPVYPQECGSRTGVYSAALTGSGLNIGIGFAGDGMTFSALPYTPHELENARHLYELPRDDNKTVVRCAAFQRGVGGDNSWGAKPHADACFAVEKGTSFRFTIQK